MAGIAIRRRVGAVAVAAVVAALLTACIPFPSPGESSNGMTNSIDTEAIAAAVTATSANIESTLVETSIDGLTTRLWLAPKITSESLTAAELDAVLRTAYTATRDKVATIEVRTITPDEETIDVAAAADELGIQHTDKIHSVTYSTEYLETAYAE